MSTQATKRERDRCQVLHEAACRKLHASSTVGAPNERIVKIDIANAKSAFNNLVAAHAEYISAMKQSLDARGNTDYMEAREQTHYNALTVADTALVTLNVADQVEEPGVMGAAEKTRLTRTKKGQLTV